jgi:hypothetical protein
MRRILPLDVLGNTMRVILAILVLLQPAAAQIPSVPEGKFRGSNGQYLTVDEARKRGLLDENPADDPPPSRDCIQTLKQIDTERADSDLAFARGEVEPTDLKQVYEQEMYYADKRVKTIKRLCFDGKSRSHDFGHWKALQALSTNRQGCEIVAKDCQPRKHW